MHNGGANSERWLNIRHRAVSSATKMCSNAFTKKQTSGRDSLHGVYIIKILSPCTSFLATFFKFDIIVHLVLVKKDAGRNLR